MERLKVKVSSESESKEVQELFFELGAKKRNIVENWHSDDYQSCWFALGGSGELFNEIIFRDNDSEINCASIFKEISLQELRDMVVLKRNDVGDATHVDADGGVWFISSNGSKFYMSHSSKEWNLNNLRDDLKPIKEEVMKEYLDPDNGYDFIKWTGFAHPPESFIEVPEGAMFATGDDVIFRKDKYLFVDDEWKETDVTLQKCKGYGLKVIWQREKESLNDKIATAEVARQEEKHSHYKKDVSHLNVIDPYRIADLYALHPCADHIMKKSLCAGNRGHKDTLRDIQDIIDTAERWKQMIEEDNNEI